jgi:dienelactone hydrolase
MEWLGKLRKAEPGKKIGMVGFCWGGRYALRAGQEKSTVEVEGKKTPLVDAVVALHPSNLVFPGDVERMVVPTSCGWGEEDSFVKIESMEKVEAIQEGERKSGRVVPEVEHRVYKPGRHGFAVRGNPDDEQERKCLEDSVTQVLEWFAKWL